MFERVWQEASATDSEFDQEGIFMRVYIDVTVLTLATFVTGIQRVTREVAVRLIQDVRFEIVLIHYNAKKNCYYQIDNKKFCEYYCKHLGIKEMMITRREVPLKEIGKGTCFFELDASWMSRVKRSYLLPVLKKYCSNNSNSIRA